MHDTSRSRPLRSSVLVTVCAVFFSVLGIPATRAQDEPAAGDTIVGELVQAYADPAPHEQGDGHDGHAEADDAGLLSWVRTAPGEAVRVPTEELGGAPAGAPVARGAGSVPGRATLSRSDGTP